MEYSPAGRANLMVAAVMTAHPTGGILAAGLGIAFLDGQGWRFLFALGALPLIIAVPAMIRYLPESLGYLGRLLRGSAAGHGFATWLPVMMRSNGYALGSALSFLLVVNLGGIVGLLIAGCTADRFGPTRVAIIWFALRCRSPRPISSCSSPAYGCSARRRWSAPAPPRTPVPTSAPPPDAGPRAWAASRGR